ncbi:MAG: DUF3368 domain-containing protein [Candidatus Heimdallarchaeaceae archaeon]
MKVISNAGPLIHLTQAGILNLLFKLFEEVIIPESVYKEVVIVGKREGYPDAIIIENAITEGKIRVYREPIKKINLVLENLHKGEKEVIELAIQLQENLVLLDDEEARIVAKKYNLRVKGTLGILIDSTKKGLIDKNSAIKYLKKINDIMYLSSDLYALVEEAIVNIQ